MLGIPSLAIFISLFLLMPLLAQFFPSSSKQFSISHEEAMQGLLRQDSAEMHDEIKHPTEQVMAEIVPLPVSSPPSDSSSDTGWVREDGVTSYIQTNGKKTTGLRYIDGKIYYFDENGRCAKEVGIDVSFYNSTVNWTAVKRSGIDFVLIRIGGRGWGTGSVYEDKLFFNYLNSAKASGLKVGAYFYSTAVNQKEAIQEAYVALDLLQNVELDMPIYIDMEFSGDYPSGRADSLSMVERTQIAKTFCRIIGQHGYPSGVYANESFFTVNLKYEELSDYSIWLASYTENNSLPVFKSSYDIWQISDRLHIAGVSGTTDLNVIF